MDDPFAAVDVPTAKHLIDNVLNGILKEKTVILVTHNKTALSVCHHIYSMENGHLLDGTCVEEDSFESIDTKKSENIISSSAHDFQNAEYDSIMDVDEMIMKEEALPEREEKLQSQNIKSHIFDIKNRATVMENKNEGSVHASTWIAYGRASGGYNLVRFSFLFHSLYCFARFTLLFRSFDYYIIYVVTLLQHEQL